ncbi:MAG: Ty3/Gypsy family RNase HI domain-containing protein, partial [bacterium]
MADTSKSKGLAQVLGLANYLHKYTRNYAEMARPLTSLLKKDVDWQWTSECDEAFMRIKESLITAPILALPNQEKSFSVVCDASDYAIGCALMQSDDDGVEPVISFRSRQLQAAEQNYPVHDKELLAMKYALVKFRVHLLGDRPFTAYTDQASLRTAVNSPHLSPRMARWLSFFAEYNFRVEYKPGKLNVLADALSRRPDYEVSNISLVTSVWRNAFAMRIQKTPFALLYCNTLRMAKKQMILLCVAGLKHAFIALNFAMGCCFIRCTPMKYNVSWFHSKVYD